MKKNFLSGLLFMCALATFGQQLPNRYLEETTPNVQVTKDVTFSTNIPTVKSFDLFGNKLANEETFGQVTTTLKMDIYQPANDNLNKRPVIIFAFGGGFVNGSRTEASMIQLCQTFAKRGFVTATIDYRLGMNIGNEELSKRAVYRALQDGRSAVRFFRKNAATYGVDADQIFISGHSAGAFLALQSVYLDKDSERPASTRNYLGRADLGGLEAIGDNKNYTNGSLVSGKANGVMSFAGALGDVNYIEGSADVVGVYFHSSDDNTVPYNSGEPFSTLSWLPGFNLPTVYGSNQLNIRANNVGASHSFYPYTNRGHGVHYNGSTLYSDVTPRGAQFFYDNRLKPSAIAISGSSSVCATCPSQIYTATNNAYYYDWQIVGGTFINRNPLSNTVTVQWNASSIVRKLTVTPYSRQLARGNATSFDINVNRPPVAKNNLNTISDFTNVDLNDYFTDPEGQALSYKISSSSDSFAKINQSNSSFLTVDRLANGNAEITIEVTDGSSCSLIQTVKLLPTAIKNDVSASIFPNPLVDNNVNVTLEGKYQGTITLQVFTGEGQLLLEKRINKLETQETTQLVIENQKQGIYFVKIISQNGEVIKKIIKN